ncbi:MAG: hypothetical protein AB1489_02835 [Acidobacteriota bacterium]
MFLHMLRAIIIICVLVQVGCSSQDKTPVNNARSSNTAPAAATPVEVKPTMGEATMTLPKDWQPFEQQQTKVAKDVESISFIRRIDRSLWANPGPAGTANLPMMNLQISRRPADARRDDIEPKRLGNNLVKQGHLTKLVEAGEIKVANLSASRIVGDSSTQGRVFIVLLPNNSYLYKWTLFGVKPNDTQSSAAFDTLLSSVQFTNK